MVKIKCKVQKKNDKKKKENINLFRTLTEVLRHSGKGISLRLTMEDVNVGNKYMIHKGMLPKKEKKERKKKPLISLAHLDRNSDTVERENFFT